MRLRAKFVAMSAAGVLLLAACGGGGGGSEADSAATIGDATSECPDGVAEVTMSWIPLAYMAPAQAAIDEGIFKKHCLKVEKREVSTNAATAASLQSGDLTFAVYNTGSAVAAATQGLDLHAIMPAFYSGEDNGIYALADSGITSVSDLSGKTVALGSTESNTHAGFVEQLKEAGVDPDTVKVVLVSIPELLASLTSGQYDAAQIMEPWITLGGDDLTPVMTNISAPFGENAPVTLWVSTGVFYQKHPEVVENFEAAIAEGVDLVTSDSAVLKQSIINGSEIPAEAVDAILKPYYSTELDMDSIEQQIAAMEELGFFKKTPDLDALFKN